MMRFVVSLLAFLALCSAPSARAELDVARLKAAIGAAIETDYPRLDAIYKDIHAHPELAFQEVKTAAKLAAEMRALGFEVTEQVGRTGLVAMYRNGANAKDSGSETVFSEWRSSSLPMVYCVIAPNT